MKKKFQVSSFKFQGRPGVVVLPTIIIFGVVALGIVVTGLFVVQLINRSTFAIRLAAEAQAAARSSIANMHLKIIKGNLPAIPVLCDDNNPIFTDYGTEQIGGIQVTTIACRYDCGLTTCRYRVRANAQSSFFVRKQVEALFDEDVVSGRVELTKIEPLRF